MTFVPISFVCKVFSNVRGMQYEKVYSFMQIAFYRIFHMFQIDFQNRMQHCLIWIFVSYEIEHFSQKP